MGIIRGLLIVLILVALGFVGYNFYQQQANVNQLYQNVNAPSEATQFLKNLRFNTNRISYFISSDCTLDRTNKFKQALGILTSETNILEFYSASEANADILVGCSKNAYEQEKNVFAAGEGGPTAYLNLSYYPYIRKGKVILYEKSECTYPVVEMHELLHVFGFAHINNKTSIMYPYGGCNHQLDSTIIEMLKKLYAIEPLAELLFTNLKASKSGKLLELELEITNQGLQDAKNVNISIYADNIMLEPIEIGDLEIGVTQTLKMTNIALPNNEISEIKLAIIYDREYDKTNNIQIIKL